MNTLRSTALAVLTLLAFSLDVRAQEALSVQTVSYFESDAARDTVSAYFELTSVARCMYGDLDALMLDIQRSDQSAELQLSVEPLPIGSGKVLYGQPLEEKRSAVSLGAYKVDFPKLESNTLYGVFLCSVPTDKKNPIPCSRSKLMDINEMLRGYRVDTSESFNEPGKVKPAPRTTEARATGEYKNYYARFVLAKNNGLTLIGGDFNEAMFAQLRSYLNANLGATEKLDAIMRDFKKYTETLGSIALEAKDSGLQMTLPYYSSKKCQGAE